MSLAKTDIESKIYRRVQTVWKSFRERKVALINNKPLRWKRKLYSQCIFSAMTHASETWTVTKASKSRQPLLTEQWKEQ